MFCCRALALCLLVAVVVDLCSGLMLERLPRHIPRSKDEKADSVEEDDQPDTSVEKKRIVLDRSQKQPFFMKPTWKAIYPLAAQDKGRSHKKREIGELEETSEADQNELANILKDDDEGDKPDKKRKKSEKKKKESHAKRKRESDQESTSKEDEQDLSSNNPNFQEWLRREYYRNMAKSFASMRRKRDDSSSLVMRKRAKKSVHPAQPASLADITDNLRDIEDQLFQDALQTIREGGENYDDDTRFQNRVSNDLNLAYDLETMRNAFFRLRETLSNMELEDNESYYPSNSKRSQQCPALEQLTSGCAILSDIVQEGSLKRMLRRACNWHEVCYTCGRAFGLTSEACDGSFIEQTQTICHNDAPCESSATLLLVPLRQRRVFYKRSNPEVCVEESCVEAFLKEGLAAMEEGQYAIQRA